MQNLNAGGEHPRPRRWLTPLRMAAGAVLIVIGLLGLALPVLPGWVFLIPGILLLAPNSRLSHWLRRQGRRLKRGRPDGQDDGPPPRV